MGGMISSSGVGTGRLRTEEVRGTVPFPVSGRRRGVESDFPISERIKVGEGRRWLEGFSLEGEGKGVWHLG